MTMMTDEVTKGGPGTKPSGTPEDRGAVEEVQLLVLMNYGGESEERRLLVTLWSAVSVLSGQN